jgi:hypothetical protein
VSEQPQVPPWWTKDPTENVKDLGEAIKATVAAEVQRQDDLRGMESRHIRELIARDREHAKELRAAEADRIDAIQTRSDLTVQRAAEVQATQAQALATQVATTADAFRSAMAAELSPVKASIEDLRRAQYEAQGQKTQTVEAREVGGASRAGVGLIVGIVGGIVGVIGLLLAFYLATKK